MHKSLVTGGAGFIGSHLVDRLLASGTEVVVCDNLSTGRLENLAQHMGKSNFKFIKLDLLDNNNLEKAMSGCDTVFHIAAHADVSSGAGDARIDLENGTLATFNVVEAMRLNNIKAIVYASSASVYGDTSCTPVSENHGPLLPVSLYGASKLAAEALISGYCHTFGMRGWIFRFANIVGSRRRQGVVYDFVHRLRQDPSHLKVLGNGTQCKPYLHVAECVDAVLFGYQHAGEIVNLFNVGVDSATDVRSIAAIVIQAMGLSDVPIRFGIPDRGWLGDAPQLRFDMRKMQALGWRPRLSSDEAVRLAASEHITELQ